MIDGVFMFCINILVVFGGKMGLVMEFILILFFEDILNKKCRVGY